MRSFLFGLFMLAGASAIAAPKDPCDSVRKPRVVTKRGAAGRISYEIKDALVLCAKPHKPNAFYVLQRSALHHDVTALERSFVPRIVETTRRAPF
jgi:hypothetical protein